MRRIKWVWVMCAALSVLSACSPQEQATYAFENSAPLPAAKAENSAVHMMDGAVLPARMWAPRRAPKAVIVALHGFNDYSNAFTSAGEFFQKRGIALYAYDQRGFGQTADVGIWAGEDNLKHDLAQVITQVSRRWPHAPVFVLGESMGGAVAIVSLADHTFPKVHGLILVSPAVWGGEAMSPMFRGSLWLMAHSFPESRFTGNDLHILASNNLAMLQALAKDPLVIKNTRVDAVYGLVQLMGNAFVKVPEVKTPTLILGGDNDQVIPPEAIHLAADRFTAHKQVVWYPDGYHLLLRDLQGKQVMEDIASWMLHPRR